MYKLCLALAFLAVAAAKPNWPLALSSFPGLGAYAPAAAYSGAQYSVLPRFGAPVAASLPAYASAYYNSVVPAVAAAPALSAYSTYSAGVPAYPAYAGAPAAYTYGATAPGYAYGSPYLWKK